MSTVPFPQWCDAARGAAFTPPTDCASRAETFERRIRRRNIIEYLAGAFVAVLFGASTVAAMVKGETLIAAALAAIVVGTGLVMWNLYQRASNLVRRPEEACLDHLRRQYAQQYKALRSIPKWYLAPLIPGIAMFYAVVTVKVAENAGWERALEGIAGPLAFTIAVFALVGAANWWAARILKRKLDALNALA